MHSESIGLRTSGMQSYGAIDSHISTDSATKSDKSERPESVKGMKVPSSAKKSKAEGTQKLPVENGHLRRAIKVGVGTLTALRVLTAIGTLGLSEGIKAGIDKLAENYGTKKTPDTPVKITLPGSDKEITLDRSMLPGRIPKGMTHGELQAKIQAKVDAGHELVNSVTVGKHDERCTVKDMTNIMFFLQCKAEATKTDGHFHEGAFSLPDPGQRLRKFLDGCPEAYQRDSSHVSGFQTQDGGKHRGIDAYGSGKNFDELLPNGMKTLLYGTMQQSDALHMPGDRLYLKIESHGAWATKPKGGGDEGGPHRLGNHHDVGAILGHSLSFINSRGQGSAAGTFKERIPSPTKKSFEALIKNAPEDLQGILKKDNPTSTAGGIRVMLANVETALNKKDPVPDTDTLKALNQFKSDTMRDYDNTSLRIGNEIIFTAGDLT